MSGNHVLLVVDQPCDETVRWLAEKMSQTGLSILRTFDLPAARFVETGCSCPVHGTQGCDCRLVVILVYQSGHSPVTIIAHGHQDQTELSLIDTPQQHADPELVALLRTALLSTVQPLYPPIYNPPLG